VYHFLTPRFDFTNILHAGFTRADLKRAKKTDGLTAFFALLGYSHAKAASKMLVIMTSNRIRVFNLKAVVVEVVVVVIVVV